MKNKLIIAILSFFIMGCGEWGSVLVSSDYEPELNIFGLLTQDNSGSFIVVTRTAKLDENLSSNDYYYNNETTVDLNIYDANVYIIDEYNDSTKFERTSNSNGYNISNSYTNDQFIPSSNSIYKLYVNTPSGLSATGELTTPNIPQLTIQDLPDILTINESFTLSWGQSDTPVGISFFDTDTLFESNFCIDREVQYYMNGETTDIFDLDLCNYIEDYIEEGELLGGVNIQLRNYDQNYYDYFILNDDNEFMNFITGQPGSTAQRFGIKGGLGVFGSFFTTNEFKFVKND